MLNNIKQRPKPKSLKRVGNIKKCLAMKTLNFEQMENVKGGIDPESLTGIFCGATLVFALSGILAPLAGATGVGCAVGLYAKHLWSKRN